MKTRAVALALGTLLPAVASLHTMELGPEMRIDYPSRGGASPAPTPVSTMGAKADEVVFSCPVEKSRKIVSMCATGDVASGKGRFYYAFGHASSPELTYPEAGQTSTDAFTRTHLGFGGNTGGYAYGFNNKGYTYAIYARSGEHHQQSGGVIVKNASTGKVVARMQCQAGKITETSSDPVIDATLKWKGDQGIASKGLPAY